MAGNEVDDGKEEEEERRERENWREVEGGGGGRKAKGRGTGRADGLMGGEFRVEERIRGRERESRVVSNE